ncbi:MAG TPA: hypothetical protein VFH64_13250 [Amnibacterium sp.]|nr:hypothetical protein [Amnibacterium sp.]
MKVLVAARTPYQEKRARQKRYEDLAEDLVYLPLPCEAAKAGAACGCRTDFAVLGQYDRSCTVARVRDRPELDRAGYTARIGAVTSNGWGEWNPYPCDDQLEPYVEALLRIADALPEGSLLERFGSGVREFHDAPVEDGRYDRWYGTPPERPLLAFDVLGRVPRALSTTIDHDWLDPETRLPARCPEPSGGRAVRPVRPARTRRERS